MVLPATCSEARNLIDLDREVPLHQHLPHQVADGTRRPDDRHVHGHGTPRKLEKGAIFGPEADTNSLTRAG